ncbi:Crp/Fnr family transcriptional regulator [Desulfosporosinus sp. Sb-LF]|uniref:Crp/Fnr family transcriptional regulator n=1 Tax=Desulfosporosinus sp. Sb-LF TaxID=2560027 RepID=UPI00107F776D|nr:Crp/Fnr family transcriptional regulator [Desulfosporosinus sp. Sb-LF]TGE31127.1 Crp/Fnr family transcriptional regulator [Desulfosporosinus sp. Sb-LF]
MDISVIPIFENLSKEQVVKIQEKAIQRTYPKKSFLFEEGQPTDGVYFILSGHIKIVKLHKDGREKTLAILKTGNILGEMTLFQNEFRTATAVALEKSTVIAIKKSDFLILLYDIPQLSIELISILSQRLADTNRQIQDLMFLNARSKVINNLIQMTKIYGKKQKDATEISLKLTHEELSNLVGITRENVTKTLNELQDLKIIEIVQKQIRILDLNKLKKEIL